MTELGRAPRRLVKTGIRVASSSMVRLLGTDATERFAGASCLVVAPHPDDETLGCGATIARMRSRGTHVEVVFVADGRRAPRPVGMTVDRLVALRREEATRALTELGVADQHVTHLSFEDGTLAECGGDIAAALSAQLCRLAPKHTLVTSVRDRHPDHAAVARATRTAVGRSAVGTRLYEFPIWQRLPAAVVIRGMVATRVRDGGRIRAAAPQLVRTGPFLDAKRRAIAAYQSQLPHFPDGFVEDFLLSSESFTEVTRGSVG